MTVAYEFWFHMIWYEYYDCNKIVSELLKKSVFSFFECETHIHEMLKESIKLTVLI